MPFIPHTAAERAAMLEALGLREMDELFAEIPPDLIDESAAGLGEGLSEAAVGRLMRERARADGHPLNFIGAGAYAHHIPAAVWELASRGEFYTAYTPYQAEVSQGTLQLVWEYQSMMTALMAMEVSNASLYDGASALAEAVLMAVRVQRRLKRRRVLVPRGLHPAYRETLATLTAPQGVELRELPFDPRGGHLAPESLAPWSGEEITALVIPQPNFFGVLEEVHALTDWAHAQGALVVAVVNPLAMALLEPPGRWGARGADIAVGEGQPLGIPLSSGGPYLGFMCCRQVHVRQMPGRLVGRTRDAEGRPGFTLTLQAREQHIRRAKATSNICSNQGLMVTAAAIHMALLGAEGLRRTALACHARLRDLSRRLCALPGIEPLFDRPVFHEQALRLRVPVAGVLRSLAAHNILGGYALGRTYAELDAGLLVCATEVHEERDLETFETKLARIVAARGEVKCPIKPNW